MPSEVVEIVRRAYDAYDADGIEGLLPFLDPEIEWRNPENSPIAGVFHGHEGVREWQRLTDEVFEELKFRPREIVEAADGRVLAVCDARVRGRESDVVLEAPFAHVVELRDGKGISLRMYPQIADARRELGLGA